MHNAHGFAILNQIAGGSTSHSRETTASAPRLDRRLLQLVGHTQLTRCITFFLIRLRFISRQNPWLAPVTPFAATSRLQMLVNQSLITNLDLLCHRPNFSTDAE